MPILSQRTAVFSKEALDVGVLINDIPGQGGIEPTTFTFSITNDYALDPSSNDYSLQSFPGAETEVGTDSNGNISVLSTFTPNDGPEGTSWAKAGGIDYEFTDGVFGQLFRGVLASGGATIDFNHAILDITMSSGDPADPGEFPNLLPGTPPVIVSQQDEEFDEEEEEGSAVLVIQYDDEGDEPQGLFVEWSEDGISWFHDGAIEFQPDNDTYLYKTYFYEVPVTYQMRVRAYKFPDEAGAPSTEYELTIDDDLPEINMTMDGGIDFGGAATIILQADPSGIYTLVANKREDTIYDRSVSPVDEVDVAIPTPFIKTGYLS